MPNCESEQQVTTIWITCKKCGNEVSMTLYGKRISILGDADKWMEARRFHDTVHCKYNKPTKILGEPCSDELETKLYFYARQLNRSE